MNNNIIWDNINNITGWSDLRKYEGFVYKIEELDTGMIYYGIKKFWKTVKKIPTKYKLNPDGSYAKDKKGKRILNTRTTRKHTRVESDWKTYKTSSPIMQKKIEENPDNYYCIIKHLCDSVTEMKAQEAYYQLKHYVEGDWHKLYNEVINLRIRIRK